MKTKKISTCFAPCYEEYKVNYFAASSNDRKGSPVKFGIIFEPFFAPLTLSMSRVQISCPLNLKKNGVSFINL